MNVFTVAAELKAKLDTISGIRAHEYPPDAVVAPAAIVGYPQAIEFDLSAGRGQDKLVVPIFVLVDRTWDRASAEQFGDLTAGSGARSVKQVIQTRPHTAFSAARVRTVSFSVIAVASIEYWCATFLVDIFGSGA